MSQTPPRLIKVFTDGASKGNPGEAGAGYVIEDGEGNVIEEGGRALGVATNNEAEYLALILAMERCLELGRTSALFFTDSQLMERQLNGKYKIKNERIGALAAKAVALRKKFERFQIVSGPREMNRRADAAATRAIEDEKANAEASPEKRGRSARPAEQGELF